MFVGRHPNSATRQCEASSGPAGRCGV